MRLAEHMKTVSWSLADKFIFILYGLVSFFQVKFSTPEEYGYFFLLNALHTWIFVVSDGLTLQNIIQFGAKKENRGNLNFLSLAMHCALTIIVSMSIFVGKDVFASVFNNPRLLSVAVSLPLLTLFNLPRSYAMKFLYRDQQIFKLFLLNFAYAGIMCIIGIYYLSIKAHFDYNLFLRVLYIGTIASSLVGLIITPQMYELKFKGAVKVKELLKFSLPNMLGSSLHMMPRLLDVFFVSYFFGPKISGVYSAAKTLFRVFDETLFAANGLVYPAAVRQISAGNNKSLNDMISKSISFLVFFFALCALLLNIGFSDFIASILLNDKFTNAVPYLNIMVLSSIATPFTILSGLIVALNRPQIVVKFIFASILVWAGSFMLVGFIQNPMLIVIPQILYYSVLGVILYKYIHKEIEFKFVQIFRAVPDSVNFIKAKLNRA